MRFKQFSEKWINEILVLDKPASQSTMRSHIRFFNERFGERPLNELNFSVIQGSILDAAKTRTPRTVKNMWGTLRLMLTQAQQENLIQGIPQPKLPKPGRVEKEWLTVAQMKQIIAAGEGMDWALYYLLAETGLRIGEALGLRKQDIDVENLRLTVGQSVFNRRVQTPKTTNAYRTISISRFLMQALVIQGNQNTKSDLVFADRFSGAPLALNSALLRMQSVMKFVGLKPVGFHAWRRGNATLCATQLGMPEFILAGRLGHGLPGVTMQYPQWYVGADREWAEKIAEVLR